MPQVTLPGDLMARVQRLVNEGEYSDVESALVDLVRRGLRDKEGGERRSPPRPPMPQRDLPPGERPVEPHPWDVNWME